MTSISSKKRTLNWPVIKWLGIVSLFLASCDAPKEIGADLFSVEVGLNFTDTLQVKSRTVLMDSIQTGGASSLLVGSYTHPVLGTFSSSIFTQFANADSLYAKKESILDSLKMQLVYKSYQGDTNQVQTINVYKLKDSLSTSTDYFTNTASISVNPTVVGSHTFRPRPIRSKASNGDSLKLDTLKFLMSPTLGRELLANYADKSLAGGGNAFRKAYPGLKISSSSGANAALLGFNPAYSRLTLYWHNPNDTLKYELNYFFSLSNALMAEVNSRYNQYQFARSGALASLVKPGNSVSAEATGQLTFVQSGSGLVTKVDFPTLLKLKGDRNVAVNKAELVFEAEDGADLNQTLGQLTLLQVDGNNKPLRNSYGLGYVLSEGGSGVQTASYNAYNRTYTFNVTTELQSILNGRKVNNGFLLTPTPTTSSTGYTKMLSETARFTSLKALKTKIRIYYSFIAK
ncbi:DUF4270 family protein [Aquirufa regiilacus]|uniref:DUF4270 family protein n=1 Tax=Aquirufa regiilacus TaxID=3024868 RepID=A0ABU3TUZ2_9BACT|nr:MULTISPECIES: DUF4270 family protein [unclassified Aquirufa]MDT8887960.1 DUF4270 family protein [Aquirufa sp. LEPPI-3A]MDU0809695.1 DUF4270 family protein [Aquirufa sp. LEOWEIH-7C]